jgi:hypothetical protein
MTSRTIGLLVLLALGLLLAPLTVAAQRAGKVYQVGHLSGISKAANKSFIDAFRAKLARTSFTSVGNEADLVVVAGVRPLT